MLLKFVREKKVLIIFEACTTYILTHIWSEEKLIAPLTPHFSPIALSLLSNYGGKTESVPSGGDNRAVAILAEQNATRAL